MLLWVFLITVKKPTWVWTQVFVRITELLLSRPIKSKGPGCVLKWWAEGTLESDGVRPTTEAKLPSHRRCEAEWIFIKSSTIWEDLICQFNYKVGAQEGSGLDSFSLGDWPSFPDSHNEKQPPDPKKAESALFSLLQRNNEKRKKCGHYSSARPIIPRKQAISLQHKRSGSGGTPTYPPSRAGSRRGNGFQIDFYNMAPRLFL